MYLKFQSDQIFWQTFLSAPASQFLQVAGKLVALDAFIFPTSLLQTNIGDWP